MKKIIILTLFVLTVILIYGCGTYEKRIDTKEPDCRELTRSAGWLMSDFVEMDCEGLCRSEGHTYKDWTCSERDTFVCICTTSSQQFGGFAGLGGNLYQKFDNIKCDMTYYDVEEIFGKPQKIKAFEGTPMAIKYGNDTPRIAFYEDFKHALLVYMQLTNKQGIRVVDYAVLYDKKSFLNYGLAESRKGLEQPTIIKEVKGCIP